MTGPNFWPRSSSNTIGNGALQSVLEHHSPEVIAGKVVESDWDKAVDALLASERGVGALVSALAAEALAINRLGSDTRQNYREEARDEDANRHQARGKGRCSARVCQQLIQRT